MSKYISFSLAFVVIIFFTGCVGSFHQQALRGDLSEVKKSVNSGIDINKKDGHGVTAVMWAAIYGKKNVVKYLTEKGANIHLKANNGMTALLYATSRGQMEIAQYLIKQGADIHQTDGLGHSSYFHILLTDNVTLKNYVLKHNENIDEQNTSGQTPLHILASRKDVRLVKYLIDNGAKMDVKDIYGYSPIFYSTDLSITQYLIAQGANINAIDNDGNTLIYSYSRLGMLDHIKYFLSKGAKVSQNDIKIAKNNEVKDLLQKHATYIKQTKVIKTQQKKVNSYLSKKDFVGLKTYTDSNPNAVYYIKNKKMRLLLTGPKGMKVGDIRKLVKDKTSEKIIVSLIKRVKSPYKEFTLKEIKIILSMGLSDTIVSAMIDVTTSLLRNEELKKQQAFYLQQQEKIMKTKTTNINHTKSSHQKTDANGNPILERVKDEVVQQGVQLLFDKLF